MQYIGVIPARYDSTRFPGKPLANIRGKSMIQRVYEQASKAPNLKKVIVATDDKRIEEHVKEFNGVVVMTKKIHQSGTERCGEVACKLFKSNRISKNDIIVNIQGDEPFIEPKQINKLTDVFCDNKIQIATLIKEIRNYDELFNENCVKVVIDNYSKALYFSRQPIPFYKNSNKNKWLDNMKYFSHVGMYAYRVDTLFNIVKLKQSNIEIAESLEQLRWLFFGYKIHAEITDGNNYSIDNKKDIDNIPESFFC